MLSPYLRDGLNLLAFKLTKGTDVGAIRPVILTYESKLPMIPIRPTSVAAHDDMGIQVWVFGPSQAVPDNYKSLVLNEARHRLAERRRATPPERCRWAGSARSARTSTSRATTTRS